MSVRWVRVGDVLELQRTPVELRPDESYRRIGIYSWGKGFLHRDPAAGAEMGSMRYFTFPSRALVLSNIQAWEGAVAVAGESEAGHVASNRFLPYVAIGDVDVTFVAHFLNSEAGLSLLRKASPGTTVRNRTLARKLFEDSKIPLPDLDEQHRIAARFDTLSRIPERLSGPHALDPAGRSVWEHVTDAAEVPLGDLVRLSSRARRVEAIATYRMLGVRWYGEGPFVRELRKGSELRARTVYEVTEGDLVYNRLFAWKGSFGVIDSALAGATVSNEFPTFEVNQRRTTIEYVSAWLRRPEVWEIVERQSTGSTTTSRNRFSIENFLGLKVRLPSFEQQSVLVGRLAAIDRVRGGIKRRNQLAAALLPAARNDEFTRLVAQAA